VAVTATGGTLAEARERGYALAATVHLRGGQLRSDIALRALQDAG
jgi:phosphoribosylamine-glycine ligase